MFTFGYSHTPPYITYRVISKEGFMHDPVPITISDPIMMHDFAITENYAIFMDLPLYFRPKVWWSSNFYEKSCSRILVQLTVRNRIWNVAIDWEIVTPVLTFWESSLFARPIVLIILVLVGKVPLRIHCDTRKISAIGLLCFNSWGASLTIKENKIPRHVLPSPPAQSLASDSSRSTCF